MVIISIFTVVQECLERPAWFVDNCSHDRRRQASVETSRSFAAGRVTEAWLFRLSPTQANRNHIPCCIMPRTFFASELRDYLLGHVRSLKSLHMMKEYILKDYGVNWR